jgi:hypothetical protein
MFQQWKWSNGEQCLRSVRLENSVVNQSLLEDPFVTFKRRDDNIFDRELIVQRGVNPFSNTNYVNDVLTRDMFLKPINTTSEKTHEDKK